MKVQKKSLPSPKLQAEVLFRILFIVYFLFYSLVEAALSAPNNVILFIADGLKPAAITPKSAPTIFKLMKEGVYFSNSHSLFPSFTMPNASAFATGHKLGDTGIYGNSIFLGLSLLNTGLSPTSFLENNSTLSTLDKIFSGDFLNQETVLKAAREKGFSTALIGKVGPILLFDHKNGDDPKTIVIDDMTGSEGGIPISDDFKQRLVDAGLDIKPPPRGNNSKSGDHKVKGTLEANKAQQDYFTLVTTKIVLPLFKERKKPFVLVYWSRDPDGTIHNQGDSLNRLIPGINGPTTQEAVKNADNNLKDLILSLETLGLKATTNILVASDHGISTISKESATSYSTTQPYDNVPFQFLPPGFVAIDLAHALDLPLFDPDDSFKTVVEGKHPLRSNGFIGTDKSTPKLIVVANGGSDLIYLLDESLGFLNKIISILGKQDYVSGIFVHDKYGPIAGTLPFSSIDLIGSAVTPPPSIIINFRSFSTGCDDPLSCSVEVADYRFQEGQGMHGSFSQADVKNFSVAIGPNFRKKFVNPAPCSNADLGITLAHLLGIKVRNTGSLQGRVLKEAMPNGKIPRWRTRTIKSQPDEYKHQTILQIQEIGEHRYFDAAGYVGRTLGLSEQKRN